MTDPDELDGRAAVEIGFAIAGLVFLIGCAVFMLVHIVHLILRCAS